VCKFGRNPAICLREEAILGPAHKCQYHVTFDLDLDLDLEHTLDARPPEDHCCAGVVAIEQFLA